MKPNALLFLFCLATPAFAQGEGGPPKPWWLTNSYKTKESGWLFHAEGEGRINRLIGNQEQRIGQGRARAFLRNGHVMGKVFTQRTDNSIVLKNPEGERFDLKIDIREHGAKVYYDLTEALYLHSGIYSEHNNRTRINRRDVYYAGLGYYVFESDAHSLKLDLSYAYGYQDVRYRKSKGPVEIEETNRKDKYVYTGLEYHWQVSKTLMASLGGEYYYNLKEKEDYRWNAGARLDTALSEVVSIGLQGVVKFHNDPAPRVVKRDIENDVNLTFSF